MTDEKVYCEDCDGWVPVDDCTIWNGFKNQWLCRYHAAERDDFMAEAHAEGIANRSYYTQQESTVNHVTA